MRTETFLKKAVAGLGSAALAIALSACAHHAATADNGYGQVRTEAPAAADNSGTAVGTVPASNVAGVATSSTPAVISGPAAVDSSGRAYTSSSAGGTGNGSSIGTNTNVNLMPNPTASAMDTTVITPEPVIVSTTPAPAVVETPTPVPMASSTVEQTPDTTATTTTTKKHHRRLHKD